MLMIIIYNKQGVQQNRMDILQIDFRFGKGEGNG